MDLYQAASQGNTEALRAAAEQGWDVNAPDKDGRSPLWFAAQSGQADACRFLIALGVDMNSQNHSILEAAVQGAHAEIVTLLWPHCNAEKEYRSLESAISLGFHEIADFLIETGEFAYLHSQVTGTELPAEDGFPERDSAAFQQWERFFFVRRGQPLPLNHVFFDYALLLAAKADRNAGLRLMEFLLGETMADPNCKIKINGHFETPLTAAAERGNLEILTVLIDRPEISLEICGKYNWPAFLHLLASPDSISTERGHAIARRLSYEAPANRFFIHHEEFDLEKAFKNVLRFGDTGLVKQVIDLVHGDAGILILPLLIRANEADGLKWILNSRILNSDEISLLRPPPAFWVLLCEHFECHEDQDALELFAGVAEFLVEKKIWTRAILKCLSMRNFSFIQQFFYPRYEPPPKEVTEKALIGLPAASTDQSLMEEWASEGFSDATLWNAIHRGIWKSPTFETLLFNSCVDPNVPDPHRSSPGRPEPQQIPHTFFGGLTSEGQNISFRSSPVVSVGANAPDSAQFQDLQMQLMLLEQQNKRRLIMAREEARTKTPLSWAITSRNAPLVDTLLLSPQVKVNSQDCNGPTPLMYAIAMDFRPAVERLLGHGDIDLNLRDTKGRSAIFYAVEGGNVDLVQLLVGTQKVDFTIRNKKDQTVRDFAKTKRKKDIVTALSG